jgi:hypothetical protein
METNAEDYPLFEKWGFLSATAAATGRAAFYSGG